MDFKNQSLKYLWLVVGFVLVVVLIVTFFLLPKNNNQSVQVKNSLSNSNSVKKSEPEVVSDKIVSVEITPNATVGNILKDQGVDSNNVQAILKAAKPIYDLVKIRVGRSLNFHYDAKTNDLKQVVYQTDSEQEIFITKKDNVWSAELKTIQYEIKIKKVNGTINSSLYNSALDQNLDVRVIIALADAFQWNIDFATAPKKGDTFVFIYEERWRDGKYIMPNNILAAKYVNAGEPYYLYYFEEDKDNVGYFDELGVSAQKMFLKAPIAYKYITSGFTTGLRCLESYGLCTGHRALDYAANSGTPIRAIGDGTVVSAGWSRVGYGNLTVVRHNGTYTTNYAHQSKFAVKTGQKVKQGQIIGYVGSTGLSTGPHLHFELVKNGVKVNPQKEILPPGKPIKSENKARFEDLVKKYQNDLK